MRIAAEVRMIALVIVVDAVNFATTASRADALADPLAVQIDTHVRHTSPIATSPGQSPSVVEYEPLAVTESWT